MDPADSRLSKSTPKLTIGKGQALAPSKANDDDIHQLRAALRGTLGIGTEDAPFVPNAGWRSGWPALAQLGVTAFCVPERMGGFSLQVGAAVATAMEFGGALHGGPYAGLVASAHALAGSGEPAANDLLADLLTGARVCAFGRREPDRDAARMVDGVAGADALLLVETGSDGLVLLSNRADWQVDDSPHGFDVTRTCGDVTFEASRGHRIAGRGHAIELQGLLLAADAVGCVQRMLDRTVAYAGQRQAFGRPIGGFQAVQHRLVDHAVRVRGMTLVVTEAADLLATGAADARRFVAMAEVSVSSSAARILHDLLQLTGAIGFTWAYGLHFFERRVHQDARLAANPRAAIRTLAEIEGWAHVG
jgi:alkylation response protein AidB-like acyl-CoA dehydrogenase